VPDHSTFSKNRYGRFRESDIYRVLFEDVVGQCCSAGLVSGEGFAVDGSLIGRDAVKALYLTALKDGLGNKQIHRGVLLTDERVPMNENWFRSRFRCKWRVGRVRRIRDLSGLGIVASSGWCMTQFRYGFFTP
jgi:hypothetical protein